MNIENSGLNSIYLGKRRDDYEELKINKSKRMENMVQKLSKLNKEFKIKMMNKNGETNISPQVKVIGESLNDFTNHLLNFYKKSYFHIKNKEKRAKFLRDLKLIISIYGKFEDIYQNTYISNNVLGNTKRKGSAPSRPATQQVSKPIPSPKVLSTLSRASSTPSPSKTLLSLPIQKEALVEENILGIKEVEENLPNNSATQCYKNSTLHLLLSIIKNELINNRININNTFNHLFIQNMVEVKTNLKNIFRDMLLGRRIEYNRLINTYFPDGLQPYEHEYMHDNNEYLNGILSNNIFSNILLNKIFNINRENIIEANIQDYQVNSTINSNLIGNIVRNIRAYVSSLPQNNTLDYIILQIAEEELEKPVTNKNGSLTKPARYGLRHNINMNLNSNIRVNGDIYQISDISYYNGAHYVSVNKRGEHFYYFNDLDRGKPRQLTERELSNGKIERFLPKTILLKKVN